jgi:hypothetical protein
MLRVAWTVWIHSGAREATGMVVAYLQHPQVGARAIVVKDDDKSMHEIDWRM